MEQDQVDKIKKLKPPTRLQKAKFAMNRVNNNVKYGFGNNTPLQMGIGFDKYNTIMSKKEKRVMELTNIVTSPLSLINLVKALFNNSKLKEIDNG